MDFLVALLKVLPTHPIRGLAALYWYLTRRKVRARNRLRILLEQSPHTYRMWINEVENLSLVKERASAVIASWTYRPRVSVVFYLDAAVPMDAMACSIRSVKEQLYQQWELVLVPHQGTTGYCSITDARMRFASQPAANTAAALNTGIAEARGDYVLALHAGDVLSPAALFHFVEALQCNPRPSIAFGDEDELDGHNQRKRPYFKPAWNPELFLTKDYLSGACLIETGKARAALPVPDDGARAAVYTLMLQVLARGTSPDIAHVPGIACHRLPICFEASQAARLRAVTAYLQATEPRAQAQSGAYGSVRVSWPLPDDPPLVSIIVPTRDKARLLRTCIDGVLKKTRYPRFEVFIVDNNSAEMATHLYFEKIRLDERVQIVRYPEPFNYSAINNFAVHAARGSYICLLNNDTEIIDGDWLSEMMRQALRPQVGAVGAKLLYGDRSIQHAGVVIGMGNAAGHAHRYLREGQPGYFHHPHLAQFMTAVTAACLVVEKRKFEAVGGLDAEHFAVAFNDTDLCLKLRAAGWQNVYTPHAVLIHHESKSRRKDTAASERTRYLRELATLQARWDTTEFQDPCHHPHLSRASEAFHIALRSAVEPAIRPAPRTLAAQTSRSPATFSLPVE